MLIWSKIKKNDMTIQKCRIWYCFWIRCKSWQKSVSENIYKQKVTKNFFTVITLCKISPIIFLGELFCTFFNGFELGIDFAFYDIEFVKKALLTLKQKLDETAQNKAKNVFYSVSSKPCFTSVWEAPFCQKKSKSLYSTRHGSGSG